MVGTRARPYGLAERRNVAKNPRYGESAHQRAFQLWLEFGSFRKVSTYKGMPVHTAIMHWAGNYACRDHCPWHNWPALKAKLAQNASQIGTAIEEAAEGQKAPGAGVGVGVPAASVDDSGIPADLIGLVRSRKSKLRVIRAIESLAMHRLRELQEEQPLAKAKGEPISMGEVGKAMGLIFRVWDEERLELGKPTQIIGADLRAEVAVLDVAVILKELDGPSRTAFVNAYRRHLAGRRAVTSA